MNQKLFRLNNQLVVFRDRTHRKLVGYDWRNGSRWKSYWKDDGFLSGYRLIGKHKRFHI